MAKERFKSYGNNAILVNENFRYLENICNRYGFRPVNGIIFDLGMSSLQLEASGRGFSFQQDAPLDMRFSPRQSLTAADIVNTYSEQELAGLLQRYGEEHRSKQIARRIAERRPLRTTLELARVVAGGCWRRTGQDSPGDEDFSGVAYRGK